MNPFIALPGWLITASLQGTLAIGLVWVCRPLVRRWLGSQAAHVLWLLVLFQLLSPWHPVSPLALLPHWGENRPPATVPEVRTRFVVSEGATTQTPAPVEAPPAPKPTDTRAIPWAAALWLVGAALILLHSVRRMSRAAHLVRRAREITDEPEIRGILPALSLVPRKLRICEIRELKTPALTGLIAPVILLPVGWRGSLSPAELRCIFEHEIGHIRRGDLLWCWLFLLARALHWFNPLVWLAEKSARLDQEIACDEWVLSHSRGLDLRLYGEVLLKALQLGERRTLTSPWQVAMAESKAGFKRRIQLLAQLRRRGWRSLAAVGLLMTLLALVMAPVSGEERDLPPAPGVTPPIVISPSQPGTPTASPGEPQVEISARFVEISGDPGKDLRELLGFPESAREISSLNRDFTAAEFADFIQKIGNRKGIEILPFPTVTTRLHHRAVTEMVREFRYPTSFNLAYKNPTTSLDPANLQNTLPVRVPPTPASFDTRNVGFTLEAEPRSIAGDEIEMLLVPKVVEFQGFVNYGGSNAAPKNPTGNALSDLMGAIGQAGDVINQPIFNTRRLQTTVTIRSGQTILIGSQDNGQAVGHGESAFRQILHPDQSFTSSGREKSISPSRYLLTFVTARVVPASPAASATPASASVTPVSLPASASSPSSTLPYGRLEPGKPGYVRSPHAPEKGLVDVRGFPRDTEVKCPYTGKVFLAP